MPQYQRPFAFLLFLVLMAILSPLKAQDSAKKYTHYDTLRGSNHQARRIFDVTSYDLNIRIDISKKTIIGYNSIYFNTVAKTDSVQIDLHRNYEVLGISFGEKWLRFRRYRDLTFVYFEEELKPGQNFRLDVHYEGKPPVSANPPWDGGFVWTQDSMGRPWAAVACEGIGASSWWPCKDYLGDEPDSMHMKFSVPEGLMGISNGQFLSIKPAEPGFNTFEWKVSYPINPYNVTINIGHYDHWKEEYTQSDGNKLALDYYVLDYDIDKAKEHFEQVKPMLGCFEKYFGPYPFARDGYALVEAPYWGMEHQSAVAYGNNFRNNKYGFDFIIIHESGHEWWGNSLSCSDPAEMWLHESFTTYSESLYMECLYGRVKADGYLMEQRRLIANKQPVLGPTGVNYETDNDIYYKGAWMLQSLRSAIDNDEKWFDILISFQQKYRYRNVVTQDFIKHLKDKTGQDHEAFVNGFTKYASPPQLEYKTQKKGKYTLISYRWLSEEKGFDMPVDIILPDGKTLRLKPDTKAMKQEKIKNVRPEEIKFAESRFYFIQVLAGS